MNKFLLSSLLAVPFCWVACSKNADIPPERESEEEMVELSFSANASPMTKADGTSDDGIIHSLDIFIFNYSQDSDGCLEAYGFYTPETSSFSTVMKISKGVKGVYAVANAPDGLLDDVTSIHSYEDVLWQFSQNSRESLVMHGDTEILITGDTYDVDVSLERYVCKMVVESITNKLPPQYGDLQIKGIYLDYVPRNVEDEDQFWRLSDGDLTTDVESMMTGSGAMSIPYGETVNLSSCIMYGFPNNASESYQYNIKDNVTKVVIETEIAGETFYYPVGIPLTDANTIYNIKNITITRLGNRAENTYVSTMTLSIDCNVVDWLTGDITGSFNGTVDGGTITF